MKLHKSPAQCTENGLIDYISLIRQETGLAEYFFNTWLETVTTVRTGAGLSLTWTRRKWERRRRRADLGGWNPTYRRLRGEGWSRRRWPWDKPRRWRWWWRSSRSSSRSGKAKVWVKRFLRIMKQLSWCSSCSTTVVKLVPHNQEVVGSNPAGCWAFPNFLHQWSALNQVPQGRAPLTVLWKKKNGCLALKDLIDYLTRHSIHESHLSQITSAWMCFLRKCDQNQDSIACFTSCRLS